MNGPKGGDPLQIQGFDAREARDFVMERMWLTSNYRDLSDEAMMMAVEWAIRLDGEYMKQAGLVKAGDGPVNPNAYYDDDDAFEYVVDAMIEHEVIDRDEMWVAMFINDFMEYHQQYLEGKGLLYWEDE